MNTRLSIFEIAKHARCSTATVSNVLNNKAKVGKEKRREVLRIISQFGYKANSAARNLRIRRSEIFALLFYPSCAEIFRNPFYSDVMEGLEERLIRARYHLLLASHQVVTTDAEIPDFVDSGKVDGVILLGRFPKKVILNFAALKVPLLLLDANVEQPVDSVISDGFSGEMEVVRHLVAKGHRRILMLAYDIEDYNIDLRIQGFLTGLKERGLPKQNTVVRNFVDHDRIYSALQSRLQEAKPPTAVVAINDTLATVIIQKLKQDGIRVPEDISVVGYDDDVIWDPPLSTVRVNRRDLGATGADLILNRLAFPSSPIAKLRMPVEFIDRKTIADIH